MAKKMIRPLRTEADYETAVDEIEAYFDKEPVPGTPDADRFDLLALVIEDYERKNWSIAPPSDLEALRYAMEIGGHTQADLGRLLGSRQRASDVLSGVRPLTMGMAGKLNRQWGVPGDALVNSSAIDEISYDAKARELTVTFVTGRVYVYSGVDRRTHAELVAAASRGRFFNERIRDHFEFREVTEEA